MEIKIGHRPFSVYAFDIETHNDDESVAKGETSTWLGYLIDEDSEPLDPRSYFYDLDEFLNRLELMTRCVKKRKKNLLIYVFNLSFEWSFLLPVLLRHNFRWTEDVGGKDSFVYSSITNTTATNVWDAKIKFHKSSGIIEFRDLNKIFPGSLRSVAKSFALPTQKGEIDYRKNRLHGYEVSDEEKIYCFKDCRIVIDVLMKMKDDKAFWKSLSAGSYSMNKMIQETYGKAWKPMLTFRKQYPELDAETNEFLRKGASGGIVYATPSFQYKKIAGNVLHIDAHQMHPYQMATRLFPFGVPEKFEGAPPWGKLCLCHVLVSYSDVKLHEIISMIGVDFCKDAELYLWDFEIEICKKCYVDFEVKYIDGYAFMAKRFRAWRYVRGNYQKRMQAKAAGDAFGVAYYKLLNNSCYGKFLEKPHPITFKNIINQDGVIDSEKIEKHDVHPNARYTYIGVGACIPAYSRCYLIETALRISPSGKDIVYFDTDSIFFLDTEETRKNIKKVKIGGDMGDWDFEPTMVRSEFSAPKRYKGLTEDGKMIVHMAGINFKDGEMPAYDDLDIDKGEFFIQGSMRVKGGTIIISKRKQLKIAGKYAKYFELNADAV